MGVLGPSEWTQQLQDPLHREEQETHFTLTALQLMVHMRHLLGGLPKNLYLRQFLSVQNSEDM
jgi:hypothetical protein